MTIAVTRAVSNGMFKKIGTWIKDNWLSTILTMVGTTTVSTSSVALIKAERLFEVLTVDSVD